MLIFTSVFSPFCFSGGWTTSSTWRSTWACCGLLLRCPISSCPIFSYISLPYRIVYHLIMYRLTLSDAIVIIWSCFDSSYPTTSHPIISHSILSHVTSSYLTYLISSNNTSSFMFSTNSFCNCNNRWETTATLSRMKCTALSKRSRSSYLTASVT